MSALAILFIALHADVAIPGAHAHAAADCNPAGKRVESADVNGDGRPDVWRLYAGKVVTCRKSDLNFDGKPDLLVHYKPDGQVWLEESDFDFDGRIDQWSIYDKGKHVCDAMDLDGDGKADAWKRYEGDKAVPEREPRGACTALR